MAARIKQLRIYQENGWSDPYDIGVSENNVNEIVNEAISNLITNLNISDIGFHRFTKELNGDSNTTITFNLGDFEYNETTDTLFVYFNGLLLVNEVEYTISYDSTNKVFTINLIKMNKGNPPHVFDEEYLELVFFRKHVDNN